MFIWCQSWLGKRKKWTLHSIVQKLIDKETDQRQNECQIQLVLLIIDAMCDVAVLYCSCLATLQAWAWGLLFTRSHSLDIQRHHRRGHGCSLRRRQEARLLAAGSSRPALALLKAMKWPWCLLVWASCIAPVGFSPLAGMKANLQLSGHYLRVNAALFVPVSSRCSAGASTGQFLGSAPFETGLCPIPGGVQGRVGCGPGQPDLVPACWQPYPWHRNRTRWYQRSFPTQAILWFMIQQATLLHLQCSCSHDDLQK